MAAFGRANARSLLRQCPRCGYDVRSQIRRTTKDARGPLPCPECGQPVVAAYRAALRGRLRCEQSPASLVFLTILLDLTTPWAAYRRARLWRDCPAMSPSRANVVFVALAAWTLAAAGSVALVGILSYSTIRTGWVEYFRLSLLSANGWRPLYEEIQKPAVGFALSLVAVGSLAGLAVLYAILRLLVTWWLATAGLAHRQTIRRLTVSSSPALGVLMLASASALARCAWQTTIFGEFYTTDAPFALRVGPFCAGLMLCLQLAFVGAGDNGWRGAAIYTLAGVAAIAAAGAVVRLGSLLVFQDPTAAGRLIGL